MKRIIIIIGALMLISFARSQTYESIIDTTKMWVVYESPYYTLYNGYTIAYKIANDSVLIDDEYWYKIVRAEDSAYTQWSVYSYIREENKIIFTKGIYDGDTLYNFNLEAGDTCFIEDLLYYIIDSSYTGFFAGKNGYTQVVNMGHDTIYEGIGSKERGLLHCYFIVGLFRTLVCYYENDSLLYKHPALETCYQNDYTNIDKINDKNNIILYPNPTNGIIRIPEALPQSSYIIYNI